MADKGSLSLAEFPIVKAETLATPHSITIYGPPGKGKTVFAASIVDVPGFERVLVIDTEGSSVALGPWYPEVDVLHAPTAALFQKYVEALLDGKLVEPTSGQPYQAVIIDTLDKAQERQLDVYANSKEAKNKQGDENTFYKWGAIKTWTSKVADYLHQADFLTIFVLHSDEGRTDETKFISTVMLQGKSQDVFPSVSDAVTYFNITKLKTDEGTQEVRTADFRPSAKLISKQRFADKLNGIIAEPTMEKVFKLIEPSRFPDTK